MKKTIISVVCIVLCGVIMFSVGVVIGKNNIQKQDTTFVVPEVKDDWKEPVEKLVAELKKKDIDGMITASAHAFGLFDVNLDGTPELIRILPGGSAGNMFCEIYDIYSGENLGDFGTGRFNGASNGEWCTYYKIDTQEYVNIGHYTTRGGADSRFKVTSQMYYDSDRQCYNTKSLIYSSYEIETTVVDDKLVENGTNVNFRIGNNEVSLDEYIDASAISFANAST